ncbi:hypothetical protein POTOM_039111 [Populus tomentosa]|uniref:Uncharacterized protein n=1 Tax=Populus tomentosa TaxID=118781 RepID=A0A8X8CJ84_POPTO|nr:hypothetical protein POTOM_039111 [Populus tomentosa]
MISIFSVNARAEDDAVGQELHRQLDAAVNVIITGYGKEKDVARFGTTVSISCMGTALVRNVQIKRHGEHNLWKLETMVEL